MTTVEIKEMPFAEKYDYVQDSLEMYLSNKTGFVRQHLGAEAATEFLQLLEKSQKPIPDGASAEARYEKIYENWARVGVLSTNFIRERLGEKGLEQLLSDEVEMLKKEHANFSLYFLALLRAVSPGRAFKIVAERLAYELQWLTPYEVVELNQKRLLIDTPDCKVLDYPGADDRCHVCQTVYPKWVAEQFKAKMVFDRQGKSCQLTAVPVG